LARAKIGTPEAAMFGRALRAARVCSAAAAPVSARRLAGYAAVPALAALGLHAACSSAPVAAAVSPPA